MRLGGRAPAPAAGDRCTAPARAWAAHRASHSAIEAKLLLLPRQPPYRNCSQLPDCLLKNQRGLAARHGPASIGWSHGEDTRSAGVAAARAELPSATQAAAHAAAVVNMLVPPPQPE